MNEINSDKVRDERRALLNANFREFQQYLAKVRHFVANQKFDMAAIYGTVAAYQAANAHCGIFASANLERALREVSSHTIGSYPDRGPHCRPSVHEHVLHVATDAQPIGGLARMLWRWIEQDSERRHSVVLTRQSNLPVPNSLLQAVQQRGGSIHFLDAVIGGLLHRARKLRKMSRRYDYVVLHIWPGDVTAFLAFATSDRCPPVIYVNHADHHFWLGVSVSDVVANLRQSGVELSAQRRGVEISRNTLLPTLLLPVKRTLSKSEAKLRLGFDPDQVLLLSVARRIKYASRTGTNFLDIHSADLATA
jgi:hypothetical protein